MSGGLWVKTPTDTRRCPTRQLALDAQIAGYRYMPDTEYAAWLDEIREMVEEVVMGDGTPGSIPQDATLLSTKDVP